MARIPIIATAIINSINVKPKERLKEFIVSPSKVIFIKKYSITDNLVRRITPKLNRQNCRLANGITKILIYNQNIRKGGET